MNSFGVEIGLYKVFRNFIGWVKSANGQNSWMTSLSYARNHAPKVLINTAELLTYSQRQFGKIGACSTVDRAIASDTGGPSVISSIQ